MIETHFHHIGVMAKDPERLEQFYTTYFGFKRVKVFVPGPGQIVTIKSGALAIEIFTAEQEAPETPIEAGPLYPCWRHVCFSVKDLDAKLKEMGEDAKITKGPEDLGVLIPGMKVAWLADPEGNIIELNEGWKI